MCNVNGEREKRREKEKSTQHRKVYRKSRTAAFKSELRWRCWVDCNAKILSIMHKYNIHISYVLLKFTGPLLAFCICGNERQTENSLQFSMRKIYICTFFVCAASVNDKKQSKNGHCLPQKKRNAKNNYSSTYKQTIQQRGSVYTLIYAVAVLFLAFSWNASNINT